jgi:hypothetical protein
MAVSLRELMRLDLSYKSLTHIDIFISTVIPMGFYTPKLKTSIHFLSAEE